MGAEDVPQPNNAGGEKEVKEKKVTRILLADDNKNVRETFAASLKYAGEGYVVETVENG